MAEAVAAVSLVASILQLVDFASKLVERLNDFNSSVDQVPKTFHNVSLELPLLLDVLNRTRGEADSGKLDASTQGVLLPVVEGCTSQINKLNDILTRLLPDKKDRSWRKKLKAFTSITQDKKVEQITSTIRNFVQTLTYHQATRLTPLEITRKKPHFGVSFDRDRNFIGREDIITRVDEAFATSGRVALSGIGGVG